MRIYLFFQVLLFVVALVTAAAAVTELNVSYVVGHESVKTLRKRRETGIEIDYCTEKEAEQVWNHIQEAAHILRAAASKLELLRTRMAQFKSHPNRQLENPTEVQMTIGIYAALMDPELRTRGINDEELSKLITLIKSLRNVFEYRKAHPMIFCSDDWLTYTDDEGRWPPRGMSGWLWDNRRVPKKLKINNGWTNLMGGRKFTENDLASIIVSNGSVPGSVTAIFTLNQYEFREWTKVDDSWTDYATFMEPYHWAPDENRYWHKTVKLTEWSGQVRLSDMVKNHLSAILIATFSMIREMLPPGRRPLESPQLHIFVSGTNYHDIWDSMIELAARDPARAHRTTYNLQFLCVALYLSNWDWSTGVNRHVWEVDRYVGLGSS